MRLSEERIMIRKYPKPILCNEFAETSLYKAGFDFSLILKDDEQKVNGDNVELLFDAELKSPVLEQLIQSDKADAFYKIQTSHDSKMCKFDIYNTATHNLNRNVLARIDKIQITLYLVASSDITLVNDEELIDEVKDFEFHFKKGDLLAVSNTETINYSLSGNSFINISLAQSQENKGLLFSSLNKQVIQIKVGPSLNDAYAVLQQKKDIKEVLNPFLAFTAILYAIEKAIFDTDNSYKDKDWYKIVEQSYESEKYDTLDDFIESMRDVFDADIVFEEIQKILNNSLEYRMRNVARRVR